MTRRENLLAAMSGKPHDWVPICPVLDNANYIDPLPGYTGDWNDWTGQLLHVGYDTYDRGPGMIGPFETVNPAVTYENTENGQIMHTEWGDLRSKVEEAEVSARVTEFLLKTPEDYKIYQKVLESNRFVYKPDNVEKNRKRLLRIGDRGIVNDMAAESPIMNLARHTVGTEQFCYDIFDEPELVAETMEIMHQKNMEVWELYAKYGTSDAIVCWDDVDTNILSRRMVEEWVVPTIRDYARIAHKYGKLMVIHTCGAIKQILDLFPKMEVDAVDWVAPAPTGNVSFKEVHNAWGSSITICGTMDPYIARYGSEQQIKETIETYFNDAKAGGRFVFFGVIPQGVSYERAKMIWDTAQKLSEY